jgi:hypothetical protein
MVSLFAFSGQLLLREEDSGRNWLPAVWMTQSAVLIGLTNLPKGRCVHSLLSAELPIETALPFRKPDQVPLTN